MPEDPNRNPDGTFKAGNNANPEGVNGHNEGWQRIGDRAQKLAEKYTAEEIVEMAIRHIGRSLTPMVTSAGADRDRQVVSAL